MSDQIELKLVGNYCKTSIDPMRERERERERERREGRERRKDRQTYE